MIDKNIWKKISSFKLNDSSVEKLEEFIIDENKDKKEVIIEIKNLSQKYKIYKKNGGYKTIFEGINFKIYKGDKIALIGANGSGKTTIVEIISGFKKQTSGDIIKNFQNIPESKKIGVQFQDLSFPKNLTVKNIIKFIVDLDKSKLTEEELLEMVDVFQLIPIIDTKVHKLSGGQQQRLNVILSLINKPVVLFLDEFTTGLDISIKNRIKIFILDYCKKNNITLVIISHDIEIMNEMIDRVIIMGDKKIIVDAPINKINKKFGSLNNLTNTYIK